VTLIVALLPRRGTNNRARHDARMCRFTDFDNGARGLVASSPRRLVVIEISLANSLKFFSPSFASRDESLAAPGNSSPMVANSGAEAGWRFQAGDCSTCRHLPLEDGKDSDDFRR